MHRALGMPSFTLALLAPTTKGKSTYLLICTSLVSFPKIKQFIGTAIGIQEHFADYPDQPRCLDDIHKAAKSEDIAQLVMAVGNGVGRMVSKRAQRSDLVQEIHSLPVVSTEKSLTSMVGSNAAAGMFARYFEIAMGQIGMFDDLCGHEDGARFSKALKSAAKEQYGTVWPRWLESLSKSWTKVEKWHTEQVPKLRESILRAAADPKLDDITSRVLDNLAFAAFAGVVATKLGLWDISARRIKAAFALVLQEHIARTPTGNSLAAAGIEAVAGYIETHGDKFPSMSVANDPDRAGHVGYLIEDDKHGSLHLFIPSEFRKLFVKQFGDDIFDTLRSAGYLVCHGSRQNRFSKRVPVGTGGVTRPMAFVAVRASIRFAK